MSQNEPSQVHLRDQAEHIAELEQFIRDVDALMQNLYPATWNNTREGILLQHRLRELNIKREEEKP